MVSPNLCKELKYSQIKIPILLLIKELNIFYHGTSFYVIIYRSYELIYMVRFSGAPCT